MHAHARPVPGWLRARFTQTSEGLETTRVTQAVEGETGDFFRLADSIIIRSARKQFEADLETLKTLLESGITSEATTS